MALKSKYPDYTPDLLVDLLPQPEKLEVSTFGRSMAIGQQQAEWSRSNGSLYLRSLDPQRGAKIEAAAEELYAIERAKVEYPEYACISSECVRGQRRVIICGGARAG